MRVPVLAVVLFVGFDAAVAATVSRGPVAADGFTKAARAPEQGRGQGRGRAQAPGQIKQRFRAMDENGDGAISRAEWTGTDQSFRVHDWNRDGVLSGTELREAAGDAAQVGTDEYDANGTLTDWTAARFTSLDRNRDGRVTAAEWLYDIDSFRRADRNRDNVLTRVEFRGGDFDDDRGDSFDNLDHDGNNRVTRQEWHASAEAFAWLDRNRDGILSRAEVQGADDETLRGDAFGRLDGNHDNRVTREEWGWSSGSFDQRDANGDGILNRREMSEAAPEGSKETATVRVGGTTRWVDTGVYVYAGDLVRFQASGRVQLSTNADDAAEPGGARRRAASAPLPDQPAGALIARVEQGGPVFVGANTAAIRATQTGRLYLSVNDDHLADNTGEFEVAITVQRSATN